MREVLYCLPRARARAVVALVHDTKRATCLVASTCGKVSRNRKCIHTHTRARGGRLSRAATRAAVCVSYVRLDMQGARRTYTARSGGAVVERPFEGQGSRLRRRYIYATRPLPLLPLPYSRRPRLYGCDRCVRARTHSRRLRVRRALATRRDATLGRRGEHGSRGFSLLFFLLPLLFSLSLSERR